jgi:ABC-2 type transport system ATP-binding protein
MLTIENLHIRYGNRAGDVIDNLSLALPAGIHGLVGLNGAGKTTLLNALYQFIPIRTGRILYNNSTLRRQSVSFLETENYFYPCITGREYLTLFPSESFDMDGWQKLFSIPLDEITENYSAGMKKKLALLAVFKTNKPILLLDEPFNSLDLESVHLLTIILNRLRRTEKTIIITSHIYESLTTCCDHIHYLHGGKIHRSYSESEFDILRDEIRDTVEQRSMTLIRELVRREK